MKTRLLVAAAVAVTAVGIGTAALADRPLDAATGRAQAVRVKGPCSRPNPDVPSGPCGGVPVFGGCQILPPNNPWNQDISGLPVHTNSAGYLNRINSFNNNQAVPPVGGPNIWLDLGADYGIPWRVVPANQPLVPITGYLYPVESDPGPYPFPLDQPTEGGEDRHAIVLQSGTCKLYELGGAERSANGWTAGVGSMFDMNTNSYRTEGHVSTDAAGLPIFPGLIKASEARAGRINHAIRMTVVRTQAGYVFPARHFASSSTNPNDPPMGLRLRMKAGTDLSSFSGEARAIGEALKKYGAIIADHGPNWKLHGDRDPSWAGGNAYDITKLPSSVFEVVETGAVIRNCTRNC